MGLIIDENVYVVYVVMYMYFVLRYFYVIFYLII